MKIYASLIGILLIIGAWSLRTETGTLTGTVADADTGEVLPGASIVLEGTRLGTSADINGVFTIKEVPVGTYTVRVSFVGYETVTKENVQIEEGATHALHVKLKPAAMDAEEVTVTGGEKQQSLLGRVFDRMAVQSEAYAPPAYHPYPAPEPEFNTEDYAHVAENGFHRALDQPLSTFSIDVDAASYSNMRRFLRDGQAPPKDAIRIEEMINYFTYDYPNPDGEHPFSITTEVGPAPWNSAHRLVHIGLQGKRIPQEDRPASNLVFLLDVSGSMASYDKLPLLKQGFQMLTGELTEQDRVAIVVYAGAAGLVLPSTPGTEKATILEALDRLEAGGSTAGAAGIQQAYQVAQEHFIEGGNNRVILATDGDFNVGVSSDGALVRLIEEKREHGVFLTVLGFGTGNLKDNKMEQIANHGNGSYYYIDGPMEAKKVLIEEMGSTLFTIAKDVKIQVEFNPAHVAAYRLIGYENRMLAAEDFDDDTKDAGELGAGHTVTALYEIIPVGAETDTEVPERGSLKYQSSDITPSALASNELMTVKLRYKQPDGDRSRLIERLVAVDETEVGTPFYFSAAVAAFGMILRDSEHKGTATPELVLTLAREAQGRTPDSYRAEFIELVETYQRIANGTSTARR